jgi:hypothetical protein
MDVSPSDDPVVVVTADTHVGPSLKRLREYCRREYLEDFDAFVAQETSAPHPTAALLESIGELYGEDEAALEELVDVWFLRNREGWPGIEIPNRHHHCGQHRPAPVGQKGPRGGSGGMPGLQPLVG